VPPAFTSASKTSLLPISQLPLPSAEQVAELYSSDLYRFAWSLAAHQGDAEDLVQQTLLRYMQKSQSIRETAKVKSWLFAVLQREFLHLRQKSRVFSSVPLEHLEERPEPANSELPNADDAVDHHAVLTALEKMDAQLRSPLVLFYLKEMKYREIAEALGVPIGTVMSRIARGKAALRTLLGVTLPTLPTNLITQ
jgi:RNA polymerase sigma-70 factor (ECF subfamily)